MYHQDHQDHHTADQVRSTTASHRPHTRLAIACVTVTATAALLSGCGGDSSEKTSDTSMRRDGVRVPFRRHDRDGRHG